MISLQQDPVPWVPAVLQHTAAGASGEADVYMVRAVETGIINVGFILFLRLKYF